MKLFKIKIKKCKDCIYYRKEGNFHFCIPKKYYDMGLNNVVGHMKVICFRKIKRKENNNGKN